MYSWVAPVTASRGGELLTFETSIKAEPPAFLQALFSFFYNSQSLNFSSVNDYGFVV